MSTTVTYKGSTIATAENQTKTLLTEGKYLEDDITIVDVTSGGGGSTLITKNISANGTYNASSDSADGYSQVNVAVPASAVDSGTKNITENGNNQDVVGYAAVNVAVPNSYSAADEGKVVSNGALVAQTSDTVTANDTYDTTLINSLTVNVSGGGSSVLKGTFTPSENANTQTLSNLVGTTLEHFLVVATPLLSSVTGHSVRAFAMGFINYEDSTFYSLGSNSSGTNVNTSTSGTISETGIFRINRTTGTFGVSNGSNGGGWFVGGVTYRWYAW